jgi:glycerophosphoryl diester phosphodiesterase
MTEIIAHRGSSLLAPENTLAAVMRAWEENADAVEVDVWMTADRRIVALHDADLLRTAGINRRVAELTVDELANIDVGSWKGPQWRGEPVPTLESLLATLPPGKRFFVEIKCGEEIVDELARVVRSSPFPQSAVIISMSLPVTKAVKRALPMCQVHGVFENDEDQEMSTHWPSAQELIAAAKTCGLDGVDVDARGMITRALVSELKSANLDVCVWTVDSPERARELIAAGVSGITTNRPGWLRRELGL